MSALIVIAAVFGNDDDDDEQLGIWQVGMQQILPWTLNIPD